MYNKISTKSNKNKGSVTETQTRVVRKVTQRQILQLNKTFSQFGTKTDFERETKITRQTVRNVLISRRGEARVIDAMMEYSQRQ